MNYVTKENQGAYFTDNELKELRKAKVRAKISDTDYMSRHPEIELIIKDLYSHILQKKPQSDEMFDFVSKYFKNLYEERCNACQ